MEIKPSDFGDPLTFQLQVEVFTDLVKYLAIYLLMYINLKQIFMICWTSTCCHCDHVSTPVVALKHLAWSKPKGGSCCSQHTHPQTSLITQLWLASVCGSLLMVGSLGLLHFLFHLLNYTDNQLPRKQFCGIFCGPWMYQHEVVIFHSDLCLLLEKKKTEEKKIGTKRTETVLADDQHHMLVILSICCGSSYILKHLKIHAIQTEIICLDLWHPSFHFSASPSAYLLQDILE